MSLAHPQSAAGWRRSWATLTDGRLSMARGCVLAAAALLPASLALFQVLLLAGIVLWASAESWRTVPARLRDSPVVALAIALWLFILLSATWSVSPPDGLREAWRYRKLLWVLPLALLFADPAWRRRLVVALLAGWSLCLAVGALGHLAQAVGWVLPTSVFRPEWGALGLNYIQFGVTQVTLAFGLLCWARLQTGRLRWALGAAAALALADALFMWNGRLPLISFNIVFVLGCVLWRPQVGKLLVALALAVLLNGLAVTQSTGWTGRAPQRELDQFEQFQTVNSTTLRLSYWRCAKDIWRDHPMLGAGAGAHHLEQERSCHFDSAEFADAARGATAHQQYLQFLAETGVLGCGLFIALLIAALRGAWRLRGSPAGETALALLLVLAAGSLFNSFLLDAIEGHLWALALGMTAVGRPTSDG